MVVTITSAHSGGCWVLNQETEIVVGEWSKGVDGTIGLNLFRAHQPTRLIGQPVSQSVSRLLIGIKYLQNFICDRIIYLSRIELEALNLFS
jgi:hypothetical protein